jgi:RNA polymerase sigma-70 factor (ECF subfamily)
MRSYKLKRKDVNAVQSKDFEKLALPLLDGLYSFACWLSGDGTEAEDLVQESIARALKGFGSFRPGTNFNAWMFTILRNVFLSKRAQLDRQNACWLEEEGDYDDLAVTNDNPEMALIRRGDAELVRQAVAKLPPGFREVLLLVDIEEMRYRDVAETLGIPTGTVMSRLARARKKLREHLVDTLNIKRAG